MAPGGYLWFYLDVLSDDGRHGFTAIMMVGSVFSPYYARARARGPGAADPLAHCAANVALYGPRGGAWALTEVPGARRTADVLAIAGSRLELGERRVVLAFNERTAPWGRPLVGEVELTFGHAYGKPVEIHGAGRHRWFPIVPHARARVTVPTHGASFEGSAYLDANQGDAPLEAELESWSWSRVATPTRTIVTYDVAPRRGLPEVATYAFDREARPIPTPSLERTDLPRTGWGLRRPHRGAGALQLVRTLEDTPFYARSALVGSIEGEPAVGVHEALDLGRFRRGWVQHLLGYRMRRAPG